jgi:predicted deacylase
MAAKNKPIIVTVTDEALQAIDNVAESLQAQGMHIGRVLQSSGVISGSAPAAKMTALRKVKGVHSVEPELEATLPPPDSKLQ